MTKHIWVIVPKIGARVTSLFGAVCLTVYGVALKGASHRIGYDSIAASGLVWVMAGKTAIAKGNFKMKLV